MAITREQIQEARQKIEAGHSDWFDYCAETDQIPANIQNMRGIARAFAEYLQQ